MWECQGQEGFIICSAHAHSRAAARPRPRPRRRRSGPALVMSLVASSSRPSGRLATFCVLSARRGVPRRPKMAHNRRHRDPECGTCPAAFHGIQSFTQSPACIALRSSRRHTGASTPRHACMYAHTAGVDERAELESEPFRRSPPFRPTKSNRVRGKRWSDQPSFGRCTPHMASLGSSGGRCRVWHLSTARMSSLPNCYFAVCTIHPQPHHEYFSKLT
jgi:hypothetical protein